MEPSDPNKTRKHQEGQDGPAENREFRDWRPRAAGSRFGEGQGTESRLGASDERDGTRGGRGVKAGKGETVSRRGCEPDKKATKTGRPPVPFMGPADLPKPWVIRVTGCQVSKSLRLVG